MVVTQLSEASIGREETGMKARGVEAEKRNTRDFIRLNKKGEFDE